MPISYPNTQQSTGGNSSTNPYVLEVIVTDNLPITVSGTTTQKLATYFFVPPNSVYKSEETQYYLGIVSYITGSNTALTASFKMQTDQNYYSTTYYDNFAYTRFADASNNLLTVNLSQVGPTGLALPLYISGTSDFTASIYKLYLSPV